MVGRTETASSSGGLSLGTKITLLCCAIAVLATAAVGLSTYWQFGRPLARQELKSLGTPAQAEPELPAIVAAAVPDGDAPAETADMLRRGMVAGLVLLLGALAVDYFVSRTVTRPLRQIALAADHFGHGETTVALPVAAPGEIGGLARALARMMERVQSSHAELESSMVQLSAAHQQLEERTRQIDRLNAELRRSNNELKQFAYVASHDLQEPLRKVTAFCQMLQGEYGDRLDDEARSYIQHAVDGALRMKNLMQDLLEFSRVETQGRPLEPTDADAACAEAIDNLAIAIEEAAAQVSCDPLPTVLADRIQLVRLFQNLIGNAIKYRGAEPPRIQICAEESGDEWVFRVRDNGIGIDPEFHERIFVIFQRLHARDKFSGNGIGLAICKRIVERAGGRIWVESAEGTGSEFCFTMSRQPTGTHADGASREPAEPVAAIGD